MEKWSNGVTLIELTLGLAITGILLEVAVHLQGLYTRYTRRISQPFLLSTASSFLEYHLRTRPRSIPTNTPFLLVYNSNKSWQIALSEKEMTSTEGFEVTLQDPPDRNKSKEPKIYPIKVRLRSLEGGNFVEYPLFIRQITP
ncbi:MAG: hypothetical protein LBR62_03145 [Puniceicoccales bacterium]|jgi:Tfp pilus assembly protein PilE|nr:hypothetical protein [Puniceicoccales bacterium]